MESTLERKSILPCSEVRSRVGVFLDVHYVFKNFDNELSKRTFKKLFEAVDGGKSYFLKSDIEKFRPLEEKIDDLISRVDCTFMTEIQSAFLQRVSERNTFAATVLAKPFTFDLSEEMPTGKLDWVSDTNESNERWRKRIKFQVLNMKDTDGESKARERLKKRYDQTKKAYDDQSQDEIHNIFLNAFAQALDPHSTHFLPAEQEDFNIKLGNQLEGIGATLQEIDGYITIQALIAGGAAQRDGRLQVSDRIVGVDSGDGTGINDVVDMELNKAVRLIRGKKGTKVKLVIVRKSPSNERLTIDLLRDSVKLANSEARGEIMELNGKKIGVVRLPSFYTDFRCRSNIGTECKGSSNDVAREVKKLIAEKADGIILDLRNNGGGDLPESIRLTGLFIPEGTVVQTVDRRRLTRTLQDQDPSVLYSGPFAVLINKYSASASEIVSGAIQDYGRGLILGDSHTYGKATVQVIQEVNSLAGKGSGGAIKVTQSKFYRPSGKSNQERGVESDLIIPSLLDANNVGEKENEFALRWDSIRAATDYRPLQNLGNIVSLLATKSQERISKNKDFNELKDKVEKFKKEKDKNSVSLKEEIKKDTKKKESEIDKENKDDLAVIKKSDFQLKEAGFILVDAIELTKGKMNWISSLNR